MESSFRQAVEWLEIDETGKEAKNDPSRAYNKFGVTEHMVKEWTGKTYSPGFSREEARDLLLKYKWIPLNCNKLPKGLDYWIFDCGYRFGPIAVKWLYYALKLKGEKEEEKLLIEVLKTKIPRDVILEIDVYARKRLKVDPLWGECKHWWTNRTNRARDRAVKFSREI